MYSVLLFMTHGAYSLFALLNVTTSSKVEDFALLIRAADISGSTVS